MFSGTSEGAGSEGVRLSGLQPVGAVGGRTGLLSQANAAPLASSSTTDQTVIAREDRLDGTLRAHSAIRVLGTVKGKLEAPSVVIEEEAKVTADVTADDVIVAGEYAGTLICRQRLEVRPSGRISGRLETLRLMLHEGASIDGEVHMIKPAQDERSPRASSSVRGFPDLATRNAPGSAGSQPPSGAGEAAS